MTRTEEEELAARVDALAHEHEGDEFVAAVRRLAAELGPDQQDVLRQILLERAADEEDFQQAVRRRAAEKGWIRRTYSRLESAWRDVGADAIVSALEAGPDGEAALVRETDRLRREAGKAALVLDELSRHSSPAVRGWVSGAARDLLGSGAARVLLGMSRDKDPRVRDRAIEELVEVSPEAARKVAPDLRRRLQSKDVNEAVTALWTLAALGDQASMPTLRRMAEGDDLLARAAEIAGMALAGRVDEIEVGLEAEDPDEIEWFAAAARLERSERARVALEECARHASAEEARRACRAELRKLGAAS
jgi:hypothetical protein